MKTQIYKHKVKKSLGQNFLKSKLALNKIIEAGEISSKDIILEIGPGKGALTEKLLERAGTVIAVEKDPELVSFLQEKFSKEILEKKLLLFNDDILNFDIKQKNYKIIANIPYNITGAIFKKFLTAENQPSLMVLMVQNEVAKRIIRKDSAHSTSLRVKESILSISVKAYGEPKIIMKVPARYFSPVPKVDSAIIKISNISRKNFTTFSQGLSLRNFEFEEKFWELIHAGFAHKRKKLSSNLKKYIGPSYGVELGNKRAEELSLEDWINLSKKIN